MKSRPAARRVVLCLFDGLRPDLVTPALMPRLAGFAGSATWLREARSVFPSVTRVATTSIVTGTSPAGHGIVGNQFLFPDVTREHVLDTSRAADLALAEAATGGRLVEATTLGDVLAAHGRAMAVVHTGSSGSAYLVNPRAKANDHWTFSIFGREHSPTPHAVDEAMARLGPLPQRTLPRFAEIDYAADLMTGHVLPRLKPDFALVWFNEPDTSFHYRLIGSDETRRVLASVDAAFGRILDWIAEQPDAADYAVIAASDHGQISTGEQVDLVGLLSEAGHPTRAPAARSLEGAAISFTGGNMGEIRVLDGGGARREAVARWLMEQPFTGMVFSRGRNAVEGEVLGTFSLGLVDLDHGRQPDLAFVLNASDAADPWGLPGVGAVTSGDIPVGGGMHGGLNRHELNTVLLLQGAGLPAGHRDDRAAGIIDIAPTILDLLGLAPAPTMIGRSLLRAAEQTTVRDFEVGANGFAQRLTRAERGASRILLSGGRA